MSPKRAKLCKTRHLSNVMNACNYRINKAKLALIASYVISATRQKAKEKRSASNQKKASI